MGLFRIVPVYHCGNPQNHVVGYRIQESVSKCGMYIQWDGLFQTEASAKSHIEKTIGCAVSF